MTYIARVLNNSGLGHNAQVWQHSALLRKLCFSLPLPRSRLRVARACTHARMAKRCPFPWHAFLLQPCNISSNHCIPAQPALRNFLPIASPHFAPLNILHPHAFSSNQRPSPGRHRSYLFYRPRLRHRQLRPPHSRSREEDQVCIVLRVALFVISGMYRAAAKFALPVIAHAHSLPPLTPIVRSQLKEVDGGSRRSFG